MLNVFHISDLHFTSEKEGLRRDYSHAAATAILELAKELKSEAVLGALPVVVITGDLVQRGARYTESGSCDFEAVQDNFLKPLQDILRIGPDRFFMVPGNHEMDISAVAPDDRKTITSLPAESDIKKDLCKKLSRYFDFIEANGYSSVTRENPRLSIFEVDGQSIACVNGLVGSYSRQGFGDKGELFTLPTEFASSFAAVKEFSIVLTHHPLSWFNDECELRLRDFLASKRCRLLTGHIHNEGVSEISTETGAFVTIQAGASSEVGESQFAVAVSWLPPSNSAAVRHFRYKDNIAQFPITPVDQTKVAPKDAEGYLNRSQAFFDPGTVLAVAASAKEISERELLFLSGKKPEQFVAPDLMHFPEDQFSGKRVKVDHIIDDSGNIFISGYELSGKSSLLAYLCYMLNNEYGTRFNQIGLYVDFRELQKADSVETFVVRRLIELGVRSAQAEYLLSVGKVRIFIDNFDANERAAVKKFIRFSESYPTLRWTCAARGSERFMPSRAPSDLEGKDASYYQLVEVSLPTVLRMIEGHETGRSAEKPRAIVHRVFQSIHNLSAPRTMFYVRSMLDIFLNDASVEPLNRYLLIENLISDRIRASHRDVFPGEPVDMQMLDSFIGLLAYHFLTHEVAFVTKAEFLTLVESFIDRKGLQKKRFEPEKILETLTNSHVLRHYESGYGFVILSIEDYFLAKHMSHDADFRSKVLSASGLLALPGAAEYYIAQNPNDRPRIDSVFSLIDDFMEEVASVVTEIDVPALGAIRNAAPGQDCRIQDQLLDEIAAIDEADEPSMLRFADPERIGNTTRVRYSVEERGAVLLQLGASILGVTRTLDQVERIAIFRRVRELLSICVKAIPLIAQHLADGHEVRLRGITVRAEYIGQLSVKEDRFYIILRGMLYNILRQFSTWAGSPSFFNSAVRLRDAEEDEIICSALFAQNIEADLTEALRFVPDVTQKVESMVLREVVARLYLDAMTLVPLERGDEARGVDALVDLTAEIFPPKDQSSAEALKRHKDALRRRFTETIGVNTYIGKRVKLPSST